MMNTFCYGPIDNDNFRSIDLYVSPKSTSESPLVVLIHGGAWRTEDKSDYRDLALDMSELGFSTASVNYRLSLDESIQHPDHILDVGKAIEYMYKTPPSDRYNREKIYLVGHSAGGHIASMLLLDTTLPYHEYIQGILSVSGIHDIPLLVKTFPSYLGFIAQAFGSDESTYYHASPVSKQSQLLKDKPIIIAQSSQDTLINDEQAHVMIQHLQSMHANVTLDMTVIGDHYDIMNTINLIKLVKKLTNCDV